MCEIRFMMGVSSIFNKDVKLEPLPLMTEGWQPHCGVCPSTGYIMI